MSLKLSRTQENRLWNLRRLLAARLTSDQRKRLFNSLLH